MTARIVYCGGRSESLAQCRFELRTKVILLKYTLRPAWKVEQYGTIRYDAQHSVATSVIILLLLAGNIYVTTAQIFEDVDSVGNYTYCPQDPTLRCYRNAKCTHHSQQMFRRNYTCDCTEINRLSSPVDRKYAGISCEYESTSSCAKSLYHYNQTSRVYDEADHQFCVNHGTCIELVAGNSKHPGCNCLEGWSGLHCEVRAAEEYIIVVEASRQDTLSTIMIGCYLAMIAAVTLNLVVLYIKFQKDDKEFKLSRFIDIGVELPSHVAADGGHSNVYTEETKELEDMSDESKIV